MGIMKNPTSARAVNKHGQNTGVRMSADEARAESPSCRRIGEAYNRLIIRSYFETHRNAVMDPFTVAVHATNIPLAWPQCNRTQTLSGVWFSKSPLTNVQG